jgi:hypothetical protein
LPFPNVNGFGVTIFIYVYLLLCNKYLSAYVRIY